MNSTNLSKEYLRSLSKDELEKLLESKTSQYEKYNSLQEALKIAINSAYGVTSTNGFVWADCRLAAAITATGQYTIKRIGVAVDSYLNSGLRTNIVRNVYNDTDSAFFVLSDIKALFAKKDASTANAKLVEFCYNKIQTCLDDNFRQQSIEHHCIEQRMKMKTEKVCSSVIFKAKKKYSMCVTHNEGKDYDQPKIVNKGIDISRSGTAEYTKRLMMEALMLIHKRDQDGLHKLYEKAKSEFKIRPLVDICPTSKSNGNLDVNSDTEDFVSGAHYAAKAASLYNTEADKFGLIRIKNGDKFFIVPLKKQNPMKYDRLAFIDEFNLPHLLNYIDRTTLFQTTFVKPMMDICKVAGMTLEKINTLDSIFG